MPPRTKHVERVRVSGEAVTSEDAPPPKPPSSRAFPSFKRAAAPPGGGGFGGGGSGFATTPFAFTSASVTGKPSGKTALAEGREMGLPWLNLGVYNNVTPFAMQPKATSSFRAFSTTLSGGTPLQFNNSDIGFRRINRKHPLLNDTGFRRDLQETHPDGVSIELQCLLPVSGSERHTVLKLALPRGFEPALAIARLSAPKKTHPCNPTDYTLCVNGAELFDLRGVHPQDGGGTEQSTVTSVPQSAEYIERTVVGGDVVNILHIEWRRQSGGAPQPLDLDGLDGEPDEGIQNDHVPLHESSSEAQTSVWHAQVHIKLLFRHFTNRQFLRTIHVLTNEVSKVEQAPTNDATAALLHNVASRLPSEVVAEILTFYLPRVSYGSNDRADSRIFSQPHTILRSTHPFEATNLGGQIVRAIRSLQSQTSFPVRLACSAGRMTGRGAAAFYPVKGDDRAPVSSVITFSALEVSGTPSPPAEDLHRRGAHPPCRRILLEAAGSKLLFAGTQLQRYTERSRLSSFFGAPSTAGFDIDIESIKPERVLGDSSFIFLLPHELLDRIAFVIPTEAPSIHQSFEEPRLTINQNVVADLHCANQLIEFSQLRNSLCGADLHIESRGIQRLRFVFGDAFRKVAGLPMDAPLPAASKACVQDRNLVQALLGNSVNDDLELSASIMLSQTARHLHSALRPHHLAFGDCVSVEHLLGEELCQSILCEECPDLKRQKIGEIVGVAVRVRNLRVPGRTAGRGTHCVEVPVLKLLHMPGLKEVLGTLSLAPPDARPACLLDRANHPVVVKFSPVVKVAEADSYRSPDLRNGLVLAECTPENALADADASGASEHIIDCRNACLEGRCIATDAEMCCESDATQILPMPVLTHTTVFAEDGLPPLRLIAAHAGDIMGPRYLRFIMGTNIQDNLIDEAPPMESLRVPTEDDHGDLDITIPELSCHFLTAKGRRELVAWTCRQLEGHQ